MITRHYVFNNNTLEGPEHRVKIYLYSVLQHTQGEKSLLVVLPCTVQENKSFPVDFRGLKVSLISSTESLHRSYCDTQLKQKRFVGFTCLSESGARIKTEYVTVLKC